MLEVDAVQEIKQVARVPCSLGWWAAWLGEGGECRDRMGLSWALF